MGCTLCPRQCGAERQKGQKGRCGADDQMRCARAALHLWEEPCLSGSRGSGAIFFSGCPLGCVFCQNYSISHDLFGKAITPRQLAGVFRRLEEQGAHNINLVSPTPYIEQIIEAMNIYRPQIPVVYNTSGYERVETLERIDPYIDIYLPDLKYVSPEISQKYSGAVDYFQAASQAVLFMLERKGENQFDDQGLMERGVILRHLVLPGNIRQTYLLIDWLREHVPQQTIISLMCQYFPAGRAQDYPEIHRTLTPGEYSRACQRLLEAGFTNGDFQDSPSASQAFVPDFDLTGLEEIG